MTSEKTKDSNAARPAVPKGMSAWDAAVSVYEALKVADDHARSELEDAEAKVLNDPHASGLMSRRQLVALLRDARNSYSHDLNQWARANGRPSVN